MNQADRPVTAEAPGGGITPVGPLKADSRSTKVVGALIRGIARTPGPVFERMWTSAPRSTRPSTRSAGTTEVLETYAGGVPVTWLQAAKRSNGVVVFLHGGAYLGGPLEQQWRWLLEIARRVDVAAVAIRYRMPPKHPFPAALDDAGTAIRAMRDAGEIDDGNWVLSGDSAGGGLALATTRTLKDDHGILPAGLVLTAPWVDLEMRSPELLAQVPQDAFLHPLWLGRAARAYAGGVPLSDPRLSPINGSFTGFPPTHLNVGTRDLFLTDVRRLARALEVAGVPVQCIEQDGGMHTYVQDIVTPEARWTIASQSAWLSQLLSRRER